MNEATMLTVLFVVCGVFFAWVGHMWYQLYRRRKDIERYAEERRKGMRERLAQSRQSNSMPRYHDEHRG